MFYFIKLLLSISFIILFFIFISLFYPFKFTLLTLFNWFIDLFVLYILFILSILFVFLMLFNSILLFYLNLFLGAVGKSVWFKSVTFLAKGAALWHGVWGIKTQSTVPVSWHKSITYLYHLPQSTSINIVLGMTLRTTAPLRATKHNQIIWTANHYTGWTQ